MKTSFFGILGILAVTTVAVSQESPGRSSGTPPGHQRTPPGIARQQGQQQLRGWIAPQQCNGKHVFVSEQDNRVYIVQETTNVTNISQHIGHEITVSATVSDQGIAIVDVQAGDIDAQGGIRGEVRGDVDTRVRERTGESTRDR